MRSMFEALRTHFPWFRGMVWTLLGEVSSKIGVLVATFGAARILTPSEFAIYTGFLAVSLTAAAISDAGLSQLVTREVASERADLMATLWSTFRLKALLLPIWLLTFTATTLLLALNQPVAAMLVAGYAGASLVAGAQMPVVSLLRGQLRFRSVASIQALGRWISAGIILTCLVLPSWQLHAATIAMLATLAGEIAMFIAAWFHLRRSVSTNNSRALSANLSPLSLKKSLPFAASTILSLTYNRMDVLVVAGLTSALQLGIYAPASRIQDALYILPIAIATVAFPLFSRLLSDSRNPERAGTDLRFMIAAGLVCSIPVVLLLTIAMPALIELVLGEEFLKSVRASRILVWSIPFAVVNAALLARLAASPYPMYATWVFVAIFCGSITLHVILDPRYGATGAAIASLLREPIGLVAAALLLRKASLSSTASHRQASFAGSESM